MLSYFTATLLYFISCAPGVGLCAFAGFASIRGDFAGTSGAFALLAVAFGSFALIVLGLFFATAIYIVFDSGRRQRPQLFVQFAAALDIKSLLKSLAQSSSAGGRG